MKKLNKLKLALRRPSHLVLAFAMLLGVAMPALTAKVSAAQITDRKIKISSSQASATGVSYEVTFTPQADTEELVIEFCDDSPLIGASCSFATGAGTRTVPDLSSASASAGTKANEGSDGIAVSVTGLSMTNGSPFTVTLTGVANPDVDASFYARIYTYDTAGASGYTAPASSGTAPTTGSYIDAGGVALSTAATIQVTARVMETLSICTSGKDISGGNYGGVGTDIDCSDTSVPDIQLGAGSPTPVIDSDDVYVKPAYFQISTNATSGATVRMKATNTCANGGLSTDGGATCDEIPGNAATPTEIVSGTAGFGLYVNSSVLTNTVSTSSGTITPSATYNDGSNDASTDHFFAMETGGTGVTSTYGSVIASSPAPVSQVNTMLEFGATASLTTPAGIYTTGESLIATGTF